MRVTIRTKQLKNREQSIYLDIYHSGKRRYEFLSYRYTKDKEQNKEIKKIVEGIKNKRELELMNNEQGFTVNFKRKANFVDYFKKHNESKKKWSIYHNTYKKVTEFAGDRVSFQEIDEKWLEKFQKFLLSQEISQNTAKEYFSVFKRILKKAYKEKIIPVNPSDYVSNIKAKDIKRDYLTIDEVKLLAKFEYIFNFPDIKKAFLFSCFTGLRFSDVKQLRWKDIKQDHLEIRQQKTQDFIYIPLSQTAKAILYQNNNVLYLPDKLVFDLPERWFTNYNLKKWFEKAGIDKNAHYHLSRHTFAVMNITQGTQIYTLSKLLSHKNLKTTEIYSNLIDEKKKEAIDNLPVIEVSL